MSVRLDPSNIVSYVGQGALRRTGSWVWYPGRPSVGEEGAYTFSRASTGTFIDRSLGLRSAESGESRTQWTDDEVGWLLELGRTNLVSEPIDFSAWTATNSPTVTGGQSDPASGMDAYLIEDDSGSVTERISITPTFTGDAVKALSLYVRAGTSQAAGGSWIVLVDDTAAANRLDATLTWESGEPSLSMAAGTHIATQSLAGGWFRLLFQSSAVTAANTHTLRIYPAKTSAQTGNLYVYGAKAVDGEFPGSFHETTRAVEILSRTMPTGTSLPTDAWARYTRWVAGMDTSGGLSFPRIWQVGDGAGGGGAPIVTLTWSSSTVLRVTHHNGTTSANADLTISVSRDDTVEALFLWNGDGSGSLIISINGAAVTSADLASALTPDDAWNGGATTYLNSRDGGDNAGAMTLRDDLLYRSVPSGSGSDLIQAFRTLPLVA